MKTLYNGKTKTVMLDEATGVVNLFFKDSATGENGVFDPGSNTVGGSVEGKGKIGLKISKHFFEIMEKNGIPTHYLGADVEQVRPLHPAMARSFPFLEIRIGRPSEAFLSSTSGSSSVSMNRTKSSLTASNSKLRL